MIEVSKDLLGQMLNVEILKYEIGNKALHYDYFKDGVTYTGFNINIYELADKAIDWIESQGFWIYKEQKEIYALMKGGIEVYGIDTKKRLDVPFMCMQWILDNKN